jgi:hypothetical protein
MAAIAAMRELLHLRMSLELPCAKIELLVTPVRLARTGLSKESQLCASVFTLVEKLKAIAD